MKLIKVSIDLLDIWKENPRDIKTVDYARLKKQILRLGLYKPLVCFLEKGRYIVLGGNMRLLILREIGIREVEVSVVEAKTKARRLEYALSDNDRAGEYIEDKLVELAFPYQNEIELQDYKVDLLSPVGLDQLINGRQPTDDLDAELADGEGDEDASIEIVVPAKHEKKVLEWLRNGEANTAAGRGIGVLRRCGSL
jgi:hypothetical protein